MTNNLAKILKQTRQKTLKAPPKLNLVEWADTYRMLSPESSSMPGRWRTSRVVAARGPMLAVTDPTVKKITVMAPTQLLKTELINNIVGYFIHQDPSPMIVMQPDLTMAEAWSKDRLDKMIRDTPALSDLVKSKKSRDSDNTILHKSFPGGHITVVGSNSPSGLASRPVRITLRDEVDKYPDSAGAEGDPSSLIVERSATFWNSLDVGVCSPTIKGRSKIEREFLLSDQRYFHVDCPHCGHNHYMVWENVKWFNDEPDTAFYLCPECKVAWTEQDRIKAITLAGQKPNGGYVAYAPFKGHAGFRTNKLASPWEPLSTLVRKWLDATKNGDIEKLKTFINTQLAETWEDKGESPEHMRLYERRESYSINTIPEGVVFLTAGVDVQKDRLEVEIVGWGRGKQSWSIDYRVLMGETSNIDNPCWQELDKILNETWTAPSNFEIGIRILAIDSGYNTQTVYTWARKYPTNRVMVVKGQEHLLQILGTPQVSDITHNGVRLKRGVRVWPVGVSVLKSELYGWLNLDGAKDDGIYPSGFCHFPQYGEEYFKMLTAEQLMKTKNKKGQTVHTWVKTYERNEALDCRNYARAAAAMMGLDRFKDHEWEILAGYSPVKSEPSPRPQQNAANTTYIEGSQKTQSQNSFWGRNGQNFWKK